MISIHTALLVLLLWIKCQSVQCQYWNGYDSGSSWEAYAQAYNYPYGQSAYDYSSSSPIIYVSTYPQSSSYDYYQQSSYNNNPYSNEDKQPIVIVVNADYNVGDDLCDVLSLVASLNNKPHNEPIYIPYPIPVCCDRCGCESEYDYSDCGCRTDGCGCYHSENCCDCNCDNNCGECRKRRPKSKCNRNSGCGCSNSDCGCKKCIKHKSDRCCRG